MGAFRTSQRRLVWHCHLGQTPECAAAELEQDKIQLIRNSLSQDHPDAFETNPPTNRYNCVAYALARSHGWFNWPARLFADDYTTASFHSPARGDVVRYHRELSGAFAHIAVVTRVSNGRITRVRSKWGNWSELSHCLKDVDPEYGRPTILLRPRRGVVPFPDLPDDEDMPECAEAGPSVLLTGGEEMSEFASTEEAIRGALERISDPRVYIRVGLASTPEVVRAIIEALPGVRELIEIGPKAAEDVLRFWGDAQARHERELTAIGLYLLQRIPTKEAVQPLAKAISEGEISGLNMYLAADALLTSAEIETINESPVTVALREAESLK
jgi:hypothetical protein